MTRDEILGMLHQRGVSPPDPDRLAFLEKDWEAVRPWYGRACVSEALEERLRNNIRRRGRDLVMRRNGR